MNFSRYIHNAVSINQDTHKKRERERERENRGERRRGTRDFKVAARVFNGMVQFFIDNRTVIV